MKNPRPEVDTARCNGCARCVEECSFDVLMLGEGNRAVVRGDRDCVGCGHCVAVCPVEAMSLPALGAPPAAADLPPAEAVEALLRARRSVRSYRAEPVPRETVERLVAAVGYAPSGCNVRPVRVTAVADPELLAAIDRAAGSALVPFARLTQSGAVQAVLRRAPAARARSAVAPNTVAGARAILARRSRGEERPGPTLGAPLLLVFHADPAQPTPGEDCCIAADHVTVLAQALGLGTCWNGVLAGALENLRPLRRRLGLPRDEKVYAVLSVGWPDVTFRRLVPPRPVPLRFV